MREAQKQSLKNLQYRVDLTDQQMKELSKILASTFGPVALSSLIEKGLAEFRKEKRKLPKKIKSHDWEGL